MHSRGSDVSNRCGLEEVWGKASPYKRGEETPERPEFSSRQSSKDDKGHKVATEGCKQSSILSTGHFQDHCSGHSPKRSGGGTSEISQELVFMEANPINLPVITMEEVGTVSFSALFILPLSLSFVGQALPSLRQA